MKKRVFQLTAEEIFIIKASLLEYKHYIKEKTENKQYLQKITYLWEKFEYTGI